MNSIEVLKAFHSNDNSLRKQAENHLNELAKNDPNSSMDLLTEALSLEENQVKRSFFLPQLLAIWVSCSLY